MIRSKNSAANGSLPPSRTHGCSSTEVQIPIKPSPHRYPACSPRQYNGPAIIMAGFEGEALFGAVSCWTPSRRRQTDAYVRSLPNVGIDHGWSRTGKALPPNAPDASPVVI